LPGCPLGKPNASRNPLKVRQKPDVSIVLRLVDLVDRVDLGDLGDLGESGEPAGFSET
jgi:hypothetical protein